MKDLFYENGKASLGRVCFFILFLFSLAFLGKSWFLWVDLPAGIPSSFTGFISGLVVWIKASQFLNSKEKELEK